MNDIRLMFNFNLSKIIRKGLNLIISWWSYPAVIVLGKEKIQIVFYVTGYCKFGTSQKSFMKIFNLCSCIAIMIKRFNVKRRV